MIPTKNYSSRFGERVRLLAIHDTEGARTVGSLGAYFQRINFASYHGAVDDDRYESFVDYSFAAWHMLNANQESDSLALCGFAAWTRDEWLRHPKMLDLASAWLAERSRARGIPLVHLDYATIRACMSDRNHPGGVVMHRDYTYATRDGNHTDLGENFPLDEIVLPKARAILVATKSSPLSKKRIDEEEDTIMQLPPVKDRRDAQVPVSPDERTLMLVANTDWPEKDTSKVYGVYAVINKNSQTPPEVRTILKNDEGAIFPQWWPMITLLPLGTTSVVINYQSPVAGMVSRTY